MFPSFSRHTSKEVNCKCGAADGTSSAFHRHFNECRQQGTVPRAFLWSESGKIIPQWENYARQLPASGIEKQEKAPWGDVTRACSCDLSACWCPHPLCHPSRAGGRAGDLSAREAMIESQSRLGQWIAGGKINNRAPSSVSAVLAPCNI